MAAPLGGRGAPHRPVLLRETIQFLAPERGGLFLDCTVGLGGHSEAILESSSETRVIGIDRDAEALRSASQRLGRFGRRFRGDTSNLRVLLGKLTASAVSLGISLQKWVEVIPKLGYRYRRPRSGGMRLVKPRRPLLSAA